MKTIGLLLMASFLVTACSGEQVAAFTEGFVQGTQAMNLNSFDTTSSKSLYDNNYIDRNYTILSPDGDIMFCHESGFTDSTTITCY